MSELIINSSSASKNILLNSKSSTEMVLNSSFGNKSININSYIDQSSAIDATSNILHGIEITSRPFEDVYGSSVESSMPLEEVFIPSEPLTETQASESRIRPPRVARGT